MAETDPGPTPDPSDDTTLIEVLAALGSEGWTENMSVNDDGEVRCPQCSTVSRPEDVGVDRLRRLEGASDPADMMAVVALTCPICESRGVVVASYGPDATEGDVFLLRALEDIRPGG